MAEARSNHLADPSSGLRELARVVESGGVVLTATFGPQKPHPAKSIVDDVARCHGFVVPDWYHEMQTTSEELLGTVEAVRAVADNAGLSDVEITEELVDAGIDSAEEMAAYRLGLAHIAPFIAGLSSDRRDAIHNEALACLDGLPPVLPKIIFLASTVR